LPKWDFTLFLEAKSKPLSKQAQLLNKKIGNLIGFGLYRLEYLKDTEVEIFRRTMISVRQASIQKRDPFRYAYHPDITSVTQSVNDIVQTKLAGKLQFRIHIIFSHIVKTVTCMYDETPLTFISNFITKNKMNLPENW
jgi:hypothetical protein